MGQFKRILTEIAETARLEPSETAIDFDERNYTDGAWWAEQDAEMQQKEAEQLERDAEVADMRLNGYA